MGQIESFWSGAVTHCSVNLHSVMRAAGGWEDLLQEPSRWLIQAGVSASRVAAWLATGAFESRGDVIRMCDQNYPKGLLDLDCPPPVLFVEGRQELLNHPSWSVVGTRSCTAYGRSVATHLGAGLAHRGWVVTSGLARGIDAAAHKGALASGRTIAVLAHGLNHTSPAAHWDLRREIIAAGGAIVSTWHDEFAPKRYTFPIRNQWVAALSSGVIVVEAPEKSGALITARIATDIGREVRVIPGPVGAPASAGCLKLLSEGAQVIANVESFLDKGTHRVSGSAGWLAKLYAGGDLVEVSKLRGCTVLELVQLLTKLEIEGVVVRLPGERFAPGPVELW